MLPELAVLVPVLGRPHRVKSTLASFQATAPGCRVLFLTDPDDTAERRAIAKAGADELACGGNYAHKIRHGIDYTTRSPLVFTAADDLEPHQGWFEAALAKLGDGIEVVGVNDLIPRKRDHQTHFLMTREYAERPTIDGNAGPFFQGYRSWYCDDELIATAKKRGAYCYAPDSIVEHLHPFAGKAPNDKTYRIGLRHSRIDGNLFRERSQLWT